MQFSFLYGKEIYVLISEVWKRIKNISRRVININSDLLGGGTSNIEITLLLLAHSLEKGMGMKNVKKSFGMEKCKKLIKIMQGLPEDISTKYYYIETYSIIKKYLEYANANDFSEIEDLRKTFSNLMRPSNLLPAGFDCIDPYIEILNQQDILMSRRSVRSYKKIYIDKSIVLTAAKIAAKAPSACNRQPEKVYICSEDKIKIFKNLIPGNKGFEEDISNWAVITARRDCFGKDEVFQWYINGGIFVTYFILALQKLGICSCVFQLPIAYDGIEKIKDMAGISKDEAIIAAIGYGYPENQVKCLKTSRRPIEETVTFF